MRFAFILGTETDVDPQTETDFEFGSDRDYEISYKIISTVVHESVIYMG